MCIYFARQPEQVQFPDSAHLLQVLLHVQPSGAGFAVLHMLVPSASVTVKNILELAYVNTNTKHHEESRAFKL